MFQAENKEKKWQDFYCQPIGLVDFIRMVNSHRDYLVVLKSFLSAKDKVLEVGCGTAVNSIYLSHCGYELTAIDSNDKVLALSKVNNEYFRGLVKFGLQDMFNLSFPDNQFKLCYSAAVISCYPAEKVREAIKEQLRVAKFVMFCEPTIRFLGHQSFKSSNLWSFNEWLEIVSVFKLVNYGGYGYGRWGRIFEKVDRIVFRNKFKNFIIRFFAPQVFFVVAQ